MRALEVFHRVLTRALFDDGYYSERLELDTTLGVTMLERLLESKPARERSTAGAIVSIAAHTALIAAAVYATAQARVQPTRPAESVRPFYFPRIPDRASAVRTSTKSSKPTGQRPIYVDPAISIKLPTIDLSGVLTGANDFHRTPLTFGGSSNPADSGSHSAGVPFSAEQVEKQVAVAAGNAPPRYPEALRQMGVEGRVSAVFVVNEQGRAEEESIRFVRSDNRLFNDAVRAALLRMRFIPAEVGGRKVRQLVEMPFVFAIAR
jgi:protein TonB